MLRRLVIICLALCLEGCGGGGSGSVAAGAPSATEGTSAFVAAFREAYPELAQGRTDRSITDDVSNTCGDVALKVDGATILRHVASRFGRDGAALPADQAKAVYELVRAKACP